ncbi:MAG: response regulator [Anaerolineae bacterium]|nr:response regulator [Anaerolineae bacterium]
MKQEASILLVDDTADNLRFLAQMLSKQGYRVRAVLSGLRALQSVRSTPPDLILLDVMMPEMSGYEVCELLRADPETADIPIIFISALDATEDKLRAFKAGGVDYVTKPFQVPEVVARVKTHLMLRSLREQLSDVNTELTHQLNQVQRLNAELAARNKALDAFSHTVAHDLRNPLGLILGYADILERYVDALERPGVQAVHGIQQVASKMDAIIKSLLVLAGVRKQAKVTLLPVNMEHVVQEALTRLEDLAVQSDAKLTLPESWPRALGYAPWIEEIWINYLSNAIKYGGEPPEVELGFTELEGDRVKFWVKDNGFGLTLQEQAQLFVPFERLERIRVEGHGLGLSIVRGIMDRLEGEAGVESAVGVGSTFFFTLLKADEQGWIPEPLDTLTDF